MGFPRKSIPQIYNLKLPLSSASGRFSMESHPNAKMVDIKIMEVPYGWRGLASEGEIGSSLNLNLIKLTHTISGIEYSVEVPETVTGYEESAELRAKAKIKFIHELHGEAWHGTLIHYQR